MRASLAEQLAPLAGTKCGDKIPPAPAPEPAKEQAIRAPKPRKTVRKLLYATDAVVQMVVPSEPRLYESAYVGRPYHEAVFGMRNSLVQVFFYGLPAGTATGARVNARVKLFKKRFPNGAVGLYIDSEVVDTPATHELVVHSRADQFRKTERTLYSLIAPGNAGVIEIRKPKPKKCP